MESTPTEGAPNTEEAVTVTTVIAENVKRLRDGLHLSGAGLAKAMQGRGIPWNRTTVAKLETGRRESLSVQELLALAVALDVPPMWLLVDPTDGRPTPVADGVNLDPWSALLWMIGREPISGEPGLWWSRVTPTIGLISAYQSAVEQLRRNRTAQLVLASSPEMAEHMDTEDELAEKDRRALRALASSMTSIERSGLTLPSVPDDIHQRATELGVQLPGGA